MLPSHMRNRTLEELEGRSTPRPQENTYLLQTVDRLRHVPLREFSAEDLRIMIGQNAGLQYLVPLALERLQRHSLTHGDYFPGDLLAAMLRADHKFWREQPQWRAQLQEIAERTIATLRGRSHKKQKEFRITLEALTEAYDTFATATSEV
jgi:hypothetical protein